MTTKAQIIDRAISGLPVAGEAVARVARSGRVITLRHVWRDEDDARVIHGVRRAWMRLAREVSARTGHDVEVYSAHGDLVGQVDAILGGAA